MPSDDTQKQGFLLNLRISALEADLAYFEARLQMIGKPTTKHEKAQVIVYRSLQKSLKRMLKQLRYQEKPTGKDSGRNLA